MAGVHGGAPLHQDKHDFPPRWIEEGFLSGECGGVSIIYISFALICGYYLYGLFGLLGYDSQQLILVGAYTGVDPHINTNLPPRGD